jgi:hypothetical protein
MTVFPAARGVAMLRMDKIIAAFHGAIARQTPYGSRVTRVHTSISTQNKKRQ